MKKHVKEEAKAVEEDGIVIPEEPVIPFKKEEYYEINISRDLKNVVWPGIGLGKHFKMIDGAKVLPKCLMTEVKKLGYEAFVVFWPVGKSDSLIDLTNRITIAFVHKGQNVKVVPWDPWDAATGSIPTLTFDIYTKLVEIHEFKTMEYGGMFWRYGYFPMSFQRDITAYTPAIVNPNAEKIYLTKNSALLEFLSDKKV